MHEYIFWSLVLASFLFTVGFFLYELIINMPNYVGSPRGHNIIHRLLVDWNKSYSFDISFRISWCCGPHCNAFTLIDLKITMQLPNMACKSLHALTPAHLHPHPPISRISSICSDLHLLQSFLPQSLCSGCSHLLEHSSLSQSPSLSLHIKVSVHILRQPLWPPWVG